jgi:hypothetical protein
VSIVAQSVAFPDKFKIKIFSAPMYLAKLIDELLRRS